MLWTLFVLCFGVGFGFFLGFGVFALLNAAHEGDMHEYESEDYHG